VQCNQSSADACFEQAISRFDGWSMRDMAIFLNREKAYWRRHHVSCEQFDSSIPLSISQ